MRIDSGSLVSIVLPTYNGASKYLYQSIKSCLDQTYGNLELIVVDDCSTDNTHEVVKSFSDNRIRYIRHERNMRLPSALNTGFRASTGKLLTWTSDDNEYVPDAIEQMVAFLRNHGDADFVYADYHVLYEGSGRLKLIRLPDQLDLARKNGVGACFLYTRRVYETVGDYDPRYELVEDYDYWIRVARQFKMVHLPRPLYVYREHPRSLRSTQSHSAALFDSILKFERYHVSTRQVARAVGEFCSATLRSQESVTRSAAIWAQILRRVLDLSFKLGLLFIGSSIHAIAARTIKALMRKATSSISNIHEPLRFLLTCFRLKPADEQRNILCLSPALIAGGAPAVLLNIATALGPKGYGFHILTANRTDNSWRDKFASRFKNVLWLGPACDDNRYYKYLRAVIARIGINVLLISNSNEGYRSLPRLTAAFPNLKIVDVLHAEEFSGTSDELLWTTKYIHRRVCVSSRLRNYMLERYQAFDISAEHANNLLVIHNGVDMKRFTGSHELRGKFKSRFGIPEETKIIAFVGRFSSEKQPLLFVDIAEAIISRTGSHVVNFVMAGDGQQLQEVKERITSSRHRHAFTLTGLIDNVEELLADTHLLMVVSESEGIPLVVTEAMSAGVPVVSTDVGAINEVVQDGLNGYLIPPTEDVGDRFASRALDLLSDSDTYTRFSTNARSAIAPEFSIDTMARSYETLFDELVSQTTDGGRDYGGRALNGKSKLRTVLLPADRLPTRSERR